MEQKDNEISEKQQELLEIIASILSELKIKVKIETQLPYKDAIKKLNSLEMDKQEKELNHFIFFVRQLFLDEKGDLDFIMDELKKIISIKAINTIFDSLIDSIKSKNFLNFLLKLGEILSEEYFEEGNVTEFIADYENKGVNNYELLFILFTKCKNCKDNTYIMENYTIYFSDSYSFEIAYKVFLSMDIYINMCNSSPEFNNYEDYLIEEEGSTSDNCLDKLKVINGYEIFIIKALRTFWVNSQCLFTEDLSDFMNDFFEFITQNGEKNIIIDNKMDQNLKIYLNYMLPHLKNLFSNFRIESLEEFKLRLYDFVEMHKEENIDFINRARSIGITRNLENETIGYISFLCANKKLMKKLESIADSNKERDENKLKDVMIKEALTRIEVNILDAIYAEIDKQKAQSEIQNIQNDNNEEKKETNEDNFSDDPKYQQLMKYIKEQNDKISDLNQKYEKDLSNWKKEKDKEISELNQKIERLNEVHKKIYFRDVSKFYIKKFDTIYKVGGKNTYEICQNIMNFNFSKSPARNLRDVIIKIVTHYLRGNKAAHIQYFITHSKYKNKKQELVKDVEKSYMDFMGFKQEEKDLLNQKIKIKEAPFIYYHYFE